jgi:hypothetical protein
MTSPSTPAQIGVTSTTTPEVVQVLDSSGVWVPFGEISSHAWTPIGGVGPPGPPGPGVAIVTSLAALQASPSSTETAYLTSGGRSGFFIWNSANVSTQVTNDPGMGIYVPPATDTTGASGAWVRQYDGLVNFGWWGAIGDGATDNAPAWSGFGTWAQAQSAAGFGVDLFVEPGVYHYDNNLCWGALINIQRFYLKGYGATFVNINSNYEPWFSLHIRNSGAGGAGDLINSTAVGDSSVTLVNSANGANYAVGDYVMVSSLDLQYGGFPPNCDQFDYAQVTSISGAHVYLDRALGYAHLSTFPDGANSSPCGKARITMLGRISAGDSLGSQWNIFHVYEGITIAPGASQSDRYYITMVGRHLKFLNCTLPPISPSMAGTIEINGCVITVATSSTNGSIPDKLVKDFIIDTTEFQGSFGIQFQNSSIDRVVFRNCKGGITGGSKQMLIQNCDMDFFTSLSIAQYGLIRNITVENSIIRTMPYLNSFGGNAATIDGTNISYANGVIKALKSAAYQLSVVLGQIVNLTNPNGYSGNVGNGIVVSLTEDSSYVYITTSLPFAGLPGWASAVLPISVANAEFINCYGCEDVLELSEARRKGFRWWEYGYQIFAGNSSPAGIGTALIGNLISVSVNVIQASRVAGSQFVIQSTYMLPISMTGSNLTLTITIDITVAGMRNFTQTALTGKTTNDSVVLNGAAQTTLPVGYWGKNYQAAFENIGVGNSASGLAVVEYTIQIDSGYGRKLTNILAS